MAIPTESRREKVAPEDAAWRTLCHATRKAPFLSGKVVADIGVDWACLRASHLRRLGAVVMLFNGLALMSWPAIPPAYRPITINSLPIVAIVIGAMLVASAIAALVCPRNIFWRASDRCMTFSYGPLVWRRRIHLEGQGLSASLRPAADNRDASEEPLPPALLIRKVGEADSVRIGEAADAATLRPAFEALSRYLNDGQDATLASVEIGDDMRASVSREPVPRHALGGSDANHFAESGERLVARPSALGNAMAVGLLVMAGGSLAGAWFPSDGQWTTRVLAVAVCCCLAGVAVVLFLVRPTTVIDRRRQSVTISRYLPRRPRVIRWSDIVGVQLCRRAGRDSESPTWTYELNLVMRGQPPARAQILSVSTPDLAREAGQQLGEFMGRPVWDHIEEG